MRRSVLNRVALIVVVLLVLAAIVYAFLPQPIEVDMAAVARGPLQVAVDEDGRTRLRDRYVVSAPLAGQMQRVELEAGDVVEAGDLLVVIEPTDPALLDPRDREAAQAQVRTAEVGVRRAETAVSQAEARLALAESELTRIRQMYDRDAATPHELDQAELTREIREHERDAAEFGVDVARFELELAEAALIRTTPDGEMTENLEIHAPVAGRVLQVQQESATVVTPGQPILELGDPNQLELEIDVLSTDAVRIAPGAEAYVEHWGGDDTLHAVVRRIEPQAFTDISALGVEEQRVNVILDFTSPPDQWERLGDGYRVEARIVTWQEADVLKAPTSALFRDEDQWAVFRVVDGRAQLQPVTTGRSTGLETQIVEGLNQGDVLIAHPSDRVADGAAVVPRNAD
ncbi:MAG: efflux RND transporter periplasmic adaptor subunit [Phycisphaeraceae bacterium]